jgi:hypothetical protein
VVDDKIYNKQEIRTFSTDRKAPKVGLSYLSKTKNLFDEETTPCGNYRPGVVEIAPKALRHQKKPYRLFSVGYFSTSPFSSFLFIS